MTLKDPFTNKIRNQLTFSLPFSVNGLPRIISSFGVMSIDVPKNPPFSLPQQNATNSSHEWKHDAILSCTIPNKL